MADSMSYTGRDIVDIRKSLLDKVPELTDKWSDLNESDLGVTLIELIAGAQDMQNFYFDTQAFETFLDTATQSKNIRSIVRTMNYRIPLIGSARGYVRVIYQDIDPARRIEVNKYSQFLCPESGIKYVASDYVSAYLDKGYVDIPVMEGEYKEKVVTKKSLLSNLTSSGEVSRRIPLNLETVADGSVEISQNDVIWEEVDDALLEYEGGTVFSLHVDSDNKVYILMSCDFTDYLPEDEDEEIRIRFVTSSGTSGIVPKDSITSLGEVDVYGATYIGNPEPTSGAWDSPDLKRVKILARRQAMTMGRYITLDDYINGVETEPYVMKCVLKDWRVDDTINEPYLVKVWVVGWDGEALSDYHKNKIKDKLISKGVTDVTVSMQYIDVVTFDVDVVLTLRTSSENDSKKIQDSVTEYIYNKYKCSNMDFGQTISIGLLYSEIKTISPYIKDVYIKLPDGDVELNDTQFPKLGTVAVEIASNNK